MKKPKGSMTVREAGRKGGITTRDNYGHEFFVEIGTKGRYKVRDLIAASKQTRRKSKEERRSERSKESEKKSSTSRAAVHVASRKEKKER